MSSDYRFLSFAELAIGFSQAPSCDSLPVGDAGNRPRGGEGRNPDGGLTQMKHVRIAAMVLAACLLVVCQSVALAQNLGAAPQSNVDRKSTRLNSSHLGISYAVFCLKK